MPPDIPENHQCGKNESAVENQSSLVNPEHFQEIALKLLIKLNDVGDACADNTADHHDDAQIENLIGRHASISPFILQHRQRSQKTGGNHDAVPVNLETEQFKSYSMHIFFHSYFCVVSGKIGKTV